jgi:hypothetical protein
MIVTGRSGVRHCLGLNQQARQRRHQGPISTGPIQPPAVDHIAGQLRHGGCVGTVHLTQQIIHAGQRVTDNHDSRLIITSGLIRACGAQQLREAHAQGVSDARQRRD